MVTTTDSAATLKSTDRAVVERLMATALRLHTAGQLAAAEPLYHQVLEIVPDHAEAMHLLGVSLLQGGRVDVAAVWLERAVAIDSDQANYHNWVSTSLSYPLHLVSEAAMTAD